MIQLSEELAQKIVDRMMKVIPYNVIITDENGIIIASGDVERIHQFHSGAKQALNIKEIVEIDCDHSQGMKPGVNSPIFFQGNLLGVIGITGVPEIVKPFSELVRVTAELLINQEYVLKNQSIQEQEKEKFLYELAYLNEEYSQGFMERGLSLGIDVTVPDIAIVINSEEKSLKSLKNHFNSLLQNGEYCFMLNPNIIVAFISLQKPFLNILRKSLEKKQYGNIKVGIGLSGHNISVSMNQAFKALHIGKHLQKDKSIYLYKDLCFISMLANIKEDYNLKKVVKILKSEGNQADLLNTLIAYVYNNGEMQTTAQALHVHRNTLNYRLERIKEVSGKDPRNFIELFELFTAYVVSML